MFGLKLSTSASIPRARRADCLRGDIALGMPAAGVVRDVDIGGPPRRMLRPDVQLTHCCQHIDGRGLSYFVYQHDLEGILAQSG